MESPSSAEDSRLDPMIAIWILEFLLRQPVHDKLINKLLFTEAFPVNLIDTKLKRVIVLRAIESEISRGSVSEKTLEELEILEKIGRVNGASASESMREAYCAVAVACSVKNFHGGSRKDGKADYSEAVDRIWRIRVSTWDLGTLIGNEYVTLRNEVEAAVFDPVFESLLLERNVGNDAVRKVRDYLNEAWEALGPSFLEIEAKKIVETEKEENFNGNSTNPISQIQVEGNSNFAPKVNETEAEVNRVAKSPRRTAKRAASHGRNARIGSKIVNTEEEDISPCSSNFDVLSTVEVNKAKAALKFTSNELLRAVNDPLPEALRTASVIAAQMETLNPSDLKISNGNSNEGVSGASTSDARENVPRKRSLMERTETARAFEWEDSIDQSREESRDGGKMASSLKRYDIARVVRRRKVKRWSVDEEHALIEAVERFGKGNWKLILNSKRDLFSERTEVDLKDKWRNMSK